MGLKHHTVIFVPHARARFRKWRVTNRQLALLATLILLLLLGAALNTWFFFTNTADLGELRRVRAENERLLSINQDFEEGVRTLERRLGDYEDRTRQLAIVAGLEIVAGETGAGIGGGEPGEGGDLVPLGTRSAALAAELERIAGRLDEQRSWIASTPAIAPVRGLLTSGFGFRRDPLTGERAFHQGIDIATAPGRPVRASADGIVVRAGRDGGSGLGAAVQLSHGYGVQTVYGHLAEVNVKPGQRVQRGEVLGTVGNTGRATGYHLHYEVHLDLQPVNPFAYLLESASEGP